MLALIQSLLTYTGTFPFALTGFGSLFKKCIFYLCSKLAQLHLIIKHLRTGQFYIIKCPAAGNTDVYFFFLLQVRWMLMADVIPTAWNSVFLCWRAVLRLVRVDEETWGRVLYFAITQFCKHLNLHCASLLLSKWGMLSGKFNQSFDECCISNLRRAESDISWLFTEWYGHLQIWKLPLQSPPEQSIPRWDKLQMEITAQMSKAEYDFFQLLFFLTVVYFSVLSSLQKIHRWRENMILMQNYSDSKFNLTFTSFFRLSKY